MATTKALELAQFAGLDNGIEVNANGEITNIGTMSSLDVSGDISTSTLTASANVSIADDAVIHIGSGNDLRLYHRSSDGHSFIDETGSGSLYIRAEDRINFRNRDGSVTTANLIASGGVELYYAGSKKFQTSNTGISVTGNVVASGNLSGVDATLTGDLTVGGNTDFTGVLTASAAVLSSTYPTLRFVDTDSNPDFTIVGGSGQVGFYDDTNNGYVFQVQASGAIVTGDLSVSGDFTVSGNTTTLNVDTLAIEDLNITLANGAANNSVADGAGITIDGANATLTYDGTNDEWDFNKNVKISGSLGVTNIVTNYIPKFNGSILDDSSISDDGSIVTVSSPTKINGPTASAGASETLILANNSGATQIQFGTAENLYGWIQVDDGGTKRPLILQAEGGAVGIGTTNPQSTLDVASGSALGSILRRDFNGAVANTASKVALTLWGQDHDSADTGSGTIANIGPMIGFGARIDDVAPNTGDIRAGIAYSYNGDLTFHAKAAASVADGSYERIRIDGATGSVGINHDAPPKMLAVNVNSDSDGVFLYSNKTQIGSLSRTTIGSTVVTSLDGNTGRDIHIGGSVNTDVILGYAGGNVGIGADNPGYKLDVQNGSSNALARIYTSGSIAGQSYQTGSGHYRWSTQNTSHILYNEGEGHTVINANSSGDVSIPTGKLTVEDSINTNQVRHNVRPTLLLDFANSKRLDSRIEFTRSTSAKYWDGKSTSKANQNYLRDTQDYTSGVWAADGASITSTTDPYGGTTAARVTADGTNDYHGIHQNYQLPFDDLVTFSAYVRQGASTGYLQMLTGGTGQPWATFDLTNGTVGNFGGAATTRIIEIGSQGWYRISITVAAAYAPAATGWYIWEMPASNSGRAVQHTSSGYFDTWGWQLEERANPPTEFLPTTNAPLTKYQPTLLSASANVPRFNHDPLTGKSKGLLIEEGHVNLIEYSESIGNWTEMGLARRLSDIGIAPDGTQTADLLYITSGGAAQNRYSFDGQVTLSAGTYTFSMYIKSAGLQYGALTVYDGTAYQAEVVFDLINGTYEVRDANTVAQGIEEVGNGWYRCWVTATIVQDLPDGNRASGVWPRYTNTSGAGSEAGDGDRVAQGILVWGAQLEQGIFATSYIPTTGSQATRASDNATMTYSNLTDWYRFDEGTIFAEYSNEYLRTTDQYVLSIQNYARNVEAVHFRSYSTVDAVQAYNDSATQGTFTGAISAGADNKVALTYSGITSSYCLNGGSVSNDPYWVMPTQVSHMQIGRATTSSSTLYRNDHIKKIAFYNERLSDAEIQALTEND